VNREPAPQSAHKAGREAYSLRQRYLIVTTLVTLLLFGFAWLAQSYVSKHSRQHRDNLEQRSQTAHIVYQLRDSVLHIEHLLEDYLWQPSPQKQYLIQHEIDTALLYFDELKQQPWLKQTGQDRALGDFGSDIRALHVSFRQIIDKLGTVKVHTLHKQLQPELAHLWEYLRTLETEIERYSTSDAQQLSTVANTITRSMWLLALAGLCLIIIGFLYFERGVLKPIAMVAQALKAEADGASHIELPSARSRESQQLIDAFAEMRFQVQDRQRALEQQAMQDSLTGLPNRLNWQRQLKKLCETAGQGSTSFAVLLIGLDRFKEINDTLGHDTGDRVLQLFGERLDYLSRNDDLVARLGSDEFAVLLRETGQEEAIHIARRIIGEMEHPFQVEQLHLYLGCSIGITLYPNSSDNADTLTRYADIAMYTAKRHKSGYAVYDPKFDTNSVHRLSLATELREALQNDQLFLTFQPQQSLRTGRISGLEVLLRWHHPVHGVVRPDDFIPLAEQTGLIHPLTTWVLEQTFSQMAAWQKRRLDSGIVAINISAFNLQSSEFIEVLEAKLKQWNIAAGRVMLEITETAMMLDPTHVKNTLRRLEALGVKLAIDDFGTGFSSLAYLKQLPVHELKIDKSFVMEMDQDENDAVIVRSTIDMAHNLGLRVVAEGVENQEIRDLLEILDCDVIQGYWLGHPEPAEAAEKWLVPLRRDRGDKIRHIRDYR
jgi:diguanylate cyclase (GGDEF)-like protein